MPIPIPGLIRAFPFLLCSAMSLYALHVDSLHRADLRAMDGLKAANEALTARANVADAMTARAQAAMQRAEGLSADLAGTRAYLKQIDDRRSAVSSALLSCRSELRKTQQRFAKSTQAEILMPSKQAIP